METKEEVKGEAIDLDFVSCLLQPQSTSPVASDPYPDYVGFRRFLLQRKGKFSSSAIAHRKDWRCNGKGYVAYRNYLKRPGQWVRSDASSTTNTPGNSGRWASSLGPQSIPVGDDSWGSSRDLHVNSSSYRNSFSSSGSFAEPSVCFVQPAYSFVGMHCIFDSCKSAVTILKFGHMSSNLLAYGATDGSLTICDVAGPPLVLHSLKGHTKEITDFDFSLNNQYIASSSLDKTVRVWGITEGTCMRVIYGISPQLCIRFHPVNNNLLLAGNLKKEINTINFSTGRIVNKLLFDKEITAIDNDHTGQITFAGDTQGCIYSVVVNSHTGSLSKAHRHRNGIKVKSPITTVQFRTFSMSTRSPVLLTCAQDGTISFFSVALEIQGYLTLCCSLKLAPRVHSIRASFCPLLSLEKGEFIVSGSEDSNVYFYDLTRPKHTCVNKLQGHAAPVIGVAWNHGENLLASSDSVGMVIVWKRAKAS